VSPRAGLGDVEKRKFLTLPGLELQLLGRPARSQSLYRLSYPGQEFSLHVVEDNIKMDFRVCTGLIWPVIGYSFRLL
jgi:hypothetical protein